MKNTHKNSSHKALSSLQQEVVIPLFFEKGEDNFPLQSKYQLLSSPLIFEVPFYKSFYIEYSFLQRSIDG